MVPKQLKAAEMKLLIRIFRPALKIQGIFATTINFSGSQDSLPSELFSLNWRFQSLDNELCIVVVNLDLFKNCYSSKCKLELILTMNFRFLFFNGQ